MSRTWWLTTNSDRQLDDVAAWLHDSQQWTNASLNREAHRLVAKSNDATLTLVCYDVGKHRPGTAQGAVVKIGSASTLTFTQELSRKVDHCGRLDEIYRLAFSFAEWDKECNLYFELEDRGIFKRVDGVYTVNPDQFFAKSLADMLTVKYILADSDKRNSLMNSDE